ncbi:MAG: type II toxin-antitoxin system VapC family toxin [Sulfuricella sp.]|nr:type II toxin-antitoxin system VapC family toxin [Sulfuricella sp.]
MKQTVYIETSVISYLAARMSRDLVVAGHQQITQEWWELRDDCELHASRLVVVEAMKGDHGASARRLELLHGIPHLAMTPQVETLVVALMEAAALPEKAVEDAFHIALATVHGMDFLLTWNCKHIANAIKRGVIERVCEMAGYAMPVICTPEELLGDRNVDRSDC